MTDMIDTGRTAWTGVVVAASLLLASQALAQSGSVGGSIGKEDKSVSGSAPAVRNVPAAAPSQAAPRARSANRSNSGGGSGSGGGAGGGAASFDGTWTFVGVSSGNCSGSVTLKIVGGRLIGEGVSGTVSANGAINAVGAGNGITAVSTGRLSGTSGSGSYQQSDGCTSRWVAQKQ